MEEAVNEINWGKIMDKFALYNGVITEFWKTNSIIAIVIIIKNKI
ncbi:hypothetical protein SAMN02745134_00665 [Clostridium acidisoli DSM 12555]|uniref:Uncharacterized protein n=1 Tax=Clostridium acidisoli DSM 12555 TaxID=1121291 RepID=A0A1W1X4L3_9CLOT|nr:hypothetical protein [Clostridium acidisoli]SMC18797.1 hypothetical protein SAMN02745134_00665 [Clostridium acidisoli DSM 12555]